MPAPSWAWLALLGGAIVVTVVAICYDGESDFGGYPMRRRVMVMQ